jgi:hypothetical protein
MSLRASEQERGRLRRLSLSTREGRRNVDIVPGCTGGSPPSGALGNTSRALSKASKDGSRRISSRSRQAGIQSHDRALARPSLPHRQQVPPPPSPTTSYLNRLLDLNLAQMSISPSNSPKISFFSFALEPWSSIDTNTTESPSTLLKPVTQDNLRYVCEGMCAFESLSVC